MQRIGDIEFVQIQRESLKVADDGRHDYDPAALLKVAKIEVTTQGVMGITAADERLIDVHHTDHPRSRNRADNFLSIGFTSHYGAMRDKLRDDLIDGVAGENIIVRCEDIITSEMTGNTLMIETQTGQQIKLVDVIPAPPCEPFSRFATGRNALSAHEMKTTLQFLSDGTRGFYMRLQDNTPVVIQAGDVLYSA